MQKNFQRMQPLVVVVLAIFAALVVTLGALQIRVWVQPGGAAAPADRSFTEQEKLDILASLSASSAPGNVDKSKVLRSLSAEATSGPTEEEKLKILEALR